MDKTPFKLALQAASELLLFQDVLADPVGQTFRDLLHLLAAAEFNSVAASQADLLYGRMFRELAANASVFNGDWWQNHLIRRILADHNPYSNQSYQNNGQIHPKLAEAASFDLAALRFLFVLDGQVLATALSELKGKTQIAPAVTWYNAPSQTTVNLTAEYDLNQKFSQTADWGSLAPDLTAYFAQYGTDDLARGRAFRWQRGSQGGYFEIIREVDPARLENLVGYERVRQPLIQNTEQFLAGLPANHALLYGARGTGKSSTVKALLNRYGEQGLRLIEVHKNWLGDYPLIVEKVRMRREKFVLFVDDLSFEADEVVYKDLKALLEGSLEARPSNLLIYATSNRRHLVKEQFGDNGRPDDTEINAWDTVEEKLSLSDRFGLTLTFAPPNQPQYLTIVRALAQQAGLQLDTAELERRALQWEIRHSGFSGRVARQFIDHVMGETALKYNT